MKIENTILADQETVFVNEGGRIDAGILLLQMASRKY